MHTAPGGSAFEGIAIYNLLRAHPKNVTVRVIGMAASAASIIAMAGDSIQIGLASFMMIHNVLLLVVGNRNDLRAVADTMEPIDRALAELYAACTGNQAADVAALMDKETWFGGDDAVDQGFADELLPADQIDGVGDGEAPPPTARAHIEIQAALKRAGYSDGQKPELLKDFAGILGVAAEAPPVGDPGQPIVPVTSVSALQAQYPDLYAAIRAVGVAAECQRIKDVEAQAMPGHAALIATLKFDGKTTGLEAAV